MKNKHLKRLQHFWNFCDRQAHDKECTCFTEESANQFGCLLINSLVKSHVARPECMSYTPRPCVNWKWVDILKKPHREYKTLVYIWGQNLGFLTSGSALAALTFCCSQVLTLMSPTHNSPPEALQSHCLNAALNLLNASDIWLASLCLNTSFHGVDPIYLGSKDCFTPALASTPTVPLTLFSILLQTE